MSKKLLSQSAFLFAMRLAGAGTTVLTQVIIAQYWGAEYLAEFLLIIAIANITAVFLPLGFQSIATYFAADYASKNSLSYLLSFRNHAVFFIVSFSLLLSIGLFILSSSDFSLLKNYHQNTLYLALSLAPAIALTFISGGILVGLREPIWGLLPDIIGRPFLIFSSIGLAILLNLETYWNVLWLAVIAIWCLSFLQAYLLQKSLTEKIKSSEETSSELNKWFKYAIPWVIIGLITDFFVDLDLIFLSGLLEKTDLAILGVILKILMLIGFAMSTIYTLVLPDLFDSHTRNLSGEMLVRIRKASWLSCLIGILALLGLSLLGNWALSLFGEEFSVGLVPLLLMTTGLIFRVMMGPSSLILSLYEKPFSSLPILIIGLLIMVVLNYLLVPKFALMGAATSIFITLIFWSFGLWLTTKKLTSLNISIFYFNPID